MKELLSLYVPKVLSELLDGVGASEREVIVSFGLLDSLLLLLPVHVVQPLYKVFLNKIGLHQLVNLLLLGMILLELLMHELGEFLLLLDLDGTVKGVHVPLHPDLLHVKVIHVLI